MLIGIASMYYRKYFDYNANCEKLEIDMYEYIEKPENFGIFTRLFSLDPTSYWNFLAKESPKLKNLAMFILSIVVQSTCCERIFKVYALFHNKSRNRMPNNIVHQLTIIKDDLMKIQNAKMKERKSKNRIISACKRKHVGIPLHSSYSIQSSHSNNIASTSSSPMASSSIINESNKVNNCNIEESFVESDDEVEELKKDPIGTFIEVVGSFEESNEINHTLESQSSELIDGNEGLFDLPVVIPLNDLNSLPTTNVPSFLQEILNKVKNARELKQRLQDIFSNDIDFSSLI